MKSVFKGIIVTGVAVLGLQSMAFAAVSPQKTPVVIEKQVALQGTGKSDVSPMKATPMQVARLSRGLRINTACDDGLPCPPRR
ncbi:MULTISPECIES: hypothetical protein [Pseudomonas syringae group]|uniref:Uncharacterized protein n=4 Tax=Pseudomonas syringae group TaxID=136849 RepID=F3GH94_PSESJ|nr:MULTISPECIES: hypothetical protein [Pseudomonas syringae group]EGH46444.1 hypothetical protein PSYPI_30703 [Pseudomonas syringae pv. pisi str. 1704B]RMU67652.1 hypothetical protein ALP24_01613 [Pseudomonas syringae pv. aptata]AZG86852.1 hypothetical protein N032_15020 [Pseudomonas syringae pv. pisi str. PP1]PYD09720.1 hypothetical protein DND62_21480 [Pseudomonas syringae pv. pisi]PYD27972.1 hypothetical protein DND67_22060 [Pseudomonas syringae pv. pisi]